MCNLDNHSILAWTAKIPRAGRKEAVVVFRQVDRLDRTLLQIAQIFRMGIEPVVREMSTILDGLQAQVTRVPEGTAALHGARPADASLSSGLSSGPSRFGEQPPTSPGPAFRPMGRRQV